MDYENANKALDKARAKNKDVLQAETSQQLCCQKFEKISESAKQGTVVMLTFNHKVCFMTILKSKIKIIKAGLEVAHACNFSTLGGQGR